MAAQCDTERSKKKSPINPLWSWSLAMYARPGVASALLELQDRYHADVLVILAALWLHRQQRGWPEGFADSLVGKSYAQWRHERILPARAQRLALAKNDPQRTIALAYELEAEQQGVALLWQGLRQETHSPQTDAWALANACAPWPLACSNDLGAEDAWQALLRVTADGG